MSTQSHSTQTAGFTLVELMITLVIAAILLAIAIPSYRSSVLKSRRTDARSKVLDLATREERYYSVQNTFTNSATNLGYPSLTFDYYQVSVTTTAATFNVTATAINSQTADTQCQKFTVTDTGSKTALDSGGADATSTCWP